MNTKVMLGDASVRSLSFVPFVSRLVLFALRRSEAKTQIDTKLRSVMIIFNYNPRERREISECEGNKAKMRNLLVIDSRQRATSNRTCYASQSLKSLFGSAKTNIRLLSLRSSSFPLSALGFIIRIGAKFNYKTFVSFDQ